jgi:hypothetical protein
MGDQPRADNALLRAMRELGHDAAITMLNLTTGYAEARCKRCQERSWTWLNARGDILREDLEGPSITSHCEQ